VWNTSRERRNCFYHLPLLLVFILMQAHQQHQLKQDKQTISLVKQLYMPWLTWASKIIGGHLQTSY
jgi:hypothetical protein